MYLKLITLIFNSEKYGILCNSVGKVFYVRTSLAKFILFFLINTKSENHIMRLKTVKTNFRTWSPVDMQFTSV